MSEAEQAEPVLSVRPEIAYLRNLLRKMGSDNPEELESTIAEAKGAGRLTSAIVQLIRLEHELHPVDDAGRVQGLEGVLARALAEISRGGGENLTPQPPSREEGGG